MSVPIKRPRQASAELDKDKDSQDTPQRRKKYHRRAVWACDECRLRKIKCNGEEPCQHCQEIARDCTYAGRVRPSLPPTQRIRVLEETLRAVRATLNDLQRTSDPFGVRLNHALSLLDGGTPASPAGAETPNDVGSHFSHSTPVDPPSAGRPPSRSTRLTSGWGYASGPAVIHRLTSLFQSSAAPSPLPLLNDNIPAVEDLYDIDVQPPTIVQLALPNDADVLELFASFAQRSMAAHPAIDNRDVKAALRDKSDIVARALLHGVCALGHLTSHQVSQCLAASNAAWAHFLAATKLLDMSRCDGLTSLQTVLLLALFAFSTGQIWRAHTYSIIALSWVEQLGLHDEGKLSTASGVSGTAVNMHSVAVGIQHFACAILALAPLGDSRQASEDQDKPSGNGVHPTDRHISTGGADWKPLFTNRNKMLQVTVDGLMTVFSGPSAANAVEQVNFARLWVIESTLQIQMEEALRNPLVSGGSRDSSRLRAWVELMAYGCQLQLYFPFLHHLKAMATGNTTSRTCSQRVLACIKTASKVINLCESLMRQDLIEPTSFSETYTLFLAVLTLLFLIAAHRGTTHPSKAWSQGELGIRILAAIRCGDNPANKCLKVIRALVQRLSHTVEFDMDEIERSTPTLCSSQQRSLSLTQDRRSTIAAIMNEENDSTPSSNSFAEQASTADTMLARANDFVLFGTGNDFQYNIL